ncbi:helix-turn-helix domain-containing protein [Bacillus mycoides]|uniref:helix-turn-helix transcriptional regulator n=1 Tax=Bacillus mycoides TaxID=1405 RepID=UPI002E1A2EA3|nr:helix-turn-helix domain-containing protein [Bacillus mycoides]
MYQNLFITRRESHMTQDDTARLVNISKQSYYLKEKRKRDFSLNEAKILAKHFKTTVDDLFEK